MTPHQTLAVAVRLFAILLALYAGRELLGFFVAGRERDDAYVVPIVATMMPLTIAVVCGLWFFPKSIARGLLTLPRDAPAQSFAPDVWLAIGSALIGLWLVASAVPALMRNTFVMYVFRSESVDKSDLISGLLYYAVQFVVGVALILGANGVRNLISWARSAGTGEPSISVVERDAREDPHAPHHER
jgi:hypothetical protein